MTLKAVRALQDADVIAYFAKGGRRSNARTIAAGHLRPGVEELPLYYPVTIEIPKNAPDYRTAMAAFYAAAAAAIAARLDQGCTVAALCEGDPLFYGSYMHLHHRLAGHYPSEVIAGVSGMAGCWCAAQLPIAQGDDVFAVLPATLDEQVLRARLRGLDAATIIKVGRHLGKVRRALAAAGMLQRAVYVERGSMPSGIVRRLADMTDDPAPYFALVLVPGWQAAT
jgi:precorrin-2/cobalt-factor-2 C20-methyltransferase